MMKRHPIPFERMETFYLEHLADDDRPSCYVAYCRAESRIVKQSGKRKFKNYAAFRVMLCRRRALRKKQLACNQ